MNPPFQLLISIFNLLDVPSMCLDEENAYYNLSEHPFRTIRTSDLLGLKLSKNYIRLSFDTNNWPQQISES